MQEIAWSSLSDRAVEVAAGAAVFGGSQYIIGYAANGGHNARRRICTTRRRFLPNDAPPSSDLSIWGDWCKESSEKTRTSKEYETAR